MNDSEATVAPSRASLRLAAIGGLVFVTFYLLHRILQGAGPADSSAAVVAAYNVEHHNALLASEIAVGFALLAFIAFLAPLVPVLWRTGQETVAVSVLAAGLLFVAMGFVSTATETALVAVADTGEPAAVSALNQLQGRVPVVLAIAAFAATIATTTYRTRLWWRWLGHASVVAAVVFLLGFVFSVLGSTPRGTLLRLRHRRLHRLDAAADSRLVAGWDGQILSTRDGRLTAGDARLNGLYNFERARSVGAPALRGPVAA